METNKPRYLRTVPEILRDLVEKDTQLARFERQRVEYLDREAVRIKGAWVEFNRRQEEWRELGRQISRLKSERARVRKRNRRYLSRARRVRATRLKALRRQANKRMRVLRMRAVHTWMRSRRIILAREVDLRHKEFRKNTGRALGHTRAGGRPRKEPSETKQAY